MPQQTVILCRFSTDNREKPPSPVLLPVRGRPVCLPARQPHRFFRLASSTICRVRATVVSLINLSAARRSGPPCRFCPENRRRSRSGPPRALNRGPVSTQAPHCHPHSSTSLSSPFPFPSPVTFSFFPNFFTSVTTLVSVYPSTNFYSIKHYPPSPRPPPVRSPAIFPKLLEGCLHFSPTLDCPRPAFGPDQRPRNPDGFWVRPPPDAPALQKSSGLPNATPAGLDFGPGGRETGPPLVDPSEVAADSPALLTRCQPAS